MVVYAIYNEMITIPYMLENQTVSWCLINWM